MKHSPRPKQRASLGRHVLARAASTLLCLYPGVSGAATESTLTIRARADLAGNVGPIVKVRVNGAVVATTEIRSTVMTDYVFAVPELTAGSKMDIWFTNDATVNGQDRNLYVAYLTTGSGYVIPNTAGFTYDRGRDAAAFDGIDVIPGQGEILWGGALRITWPQAAVVDTTLPKKYAASRFLQQATFGPTPEEIDRLSAMSYQSWIAEQMAIQPKAEFVSFVQSKFNLGKDYIPHGVRYNPTWVTQQFWATAATSPDQLRKRTAFALHQIFMISQTDSNLWGHARAYANYLDMLNRQAFGNFRDLLEDVALSPAMGIYLSHLRNRKEDPATGRLPDENFAREVMQLFTIGLRELNVDGTPKTDANGQPISTYTNADVMALAKVFTGWSWGFPDSQLTESIFRYGNPDYTPANDQKLDLQQMKPYAALHSTAEKRLFEGKPHQVVIPAGGTARTDLKMALDALFNHPNVGPFIGRQLIQHLVMSNPSPAYVARVANVFNNNGQGVRGDLAAVIRAVLLDAEARTVPTTGTKGSRLRDPVTRVAHWMRSFGAKSKSGEYLIAYELESLAQRPMNATSVFGYFRPGYVPPNTAFASAGMTAPEFQIVDESTSASWINTAFFMSTSGLGIPGSRDVTASYLTQAAMSKRGDVAGLIENVNLLLFAGTMSPSLKANLMDAATTVAGSSDESHLNRARLVVFLALSSPEYLVQR